MQYASTKLPKIGLLYLDHVLRFFDRSNFKGWPDKIESVVYKWGNDKQRFIKEIKQKKIDILVGNIPATAYECFRDIARELPHVNFIPSIDAQFSNKSKENVTYFCEKYHLPTPKTYIFYDREKADIFLSSTTYPKIIKRSYGPSNYGGYYVHKVDNEKEARQLLTKKQYNPLYLQDFINMKADIRVMLIGHKPVCAFWRHPPEGGWLTNTSQGGSMHYMDVPKEALEIAVRASKAANAEYWSCDVAVSCNTEYSILECATAFAAFPYVRDWIGQYLMWKLSSGKMPCPNIPLYNWEELGKLKSSVLKSMRYITFGKSYDAAEVTDTCETFHSIDNDYPVINTRSHRHEEWPSEIWNNQNNYRWGEVKKDNVDVSNAFICSGKESTILASVSNQVMEQAVDSGIEEAKVAANVLAIDEKNVDIEDDNISVFQELLSENRMIELLSSAKGISKSLAKKVLARFGLQRLIEILQNEPEKLTEIKNIKDKRLSNIMKRWKIHLETC